MACDFPGGGGPDPLSPPLDPHFNILCVYLVYFRSNYFRLKINPEAMDFELTKGNKF